MFDVSYPVAFAAGVLSFFAPCVVSLLPAYVAYVTGVSLADLQTFGIARYRAKLVISSIFYILGFSLVFVILGTAAAGIGQVLRQYENIIRLVGGAVILVMGLNFAGFLNLPFLRAEHKFQLPAWSQSLGYTRSFLIGLVFAMAWTPCVGAILGAILSLAAVSATASTGALLLFVYSLGISIPFMLVSLTLAQAPRYLSFIANRIGIISKIAGSLLAILGILLLTDTYKYVNSWLFEIAFRLGYQIR